MSTLQEAVALLAECQINVDNSGLLKRITLFLAKTEESYISKLPETPEEAIEFIGVNFCSMELEGEFMDRRITLTVHDLLSAFSNLAIDIEESSVSPDEKLIEAVGKLIKAKGRFHTEQNYAGVVAAYDAALAAMGAEEKK